MSQGYIDTRFNNQPIVITDGNWWYHESCAVRAERIRWRQVTDLEYSMDEVRQICCKGCWDRDRVDTKFGPALQPDRNMERMHFL